MGYDLLKIDEYHEWFLANHDHRWRTDFTSGITGLPLQKSCTEYGCSAKFIPSDRPGGPGTVVSYHDHARQRVQHNRLRPWSIEFLLIFWGFGLFFRMLRWGARLALALIKSIITNTARTSWEGNKIIDGWLTDTGERSRADGLRVLAAGGYAGA